jgi:hypothetical protein
VTTYCNKCTHVFRVYKNDPPQRWLCVKHRRAEGWRHTCEGYRSAAPYGRCDDMNLGMCPIYEEAPQERQIKLTQEEQT